MFTLNQFGYQVIICLLSCTSEKIYERRPVRKSPRLPAKAVKVRGGEVWYILLRHGPHQLPIPGSELSEGRAYFYAVIHVSIKCQCQSKKQAEKKWRSEWRLESRQRMLNEWAHVAGKVWHCQNHISIAARLDGQIWRFGKVPGLWFDHTADMLMKISRWCQRKIECLSPRFAYSPPRRCCLLVKWAETHVCAEKGWEKPPPPTTSSSSRTDSSSGNSVIWHRICPPYRFPPFSILFMIRPSKDTGISWRTTCRMRNITSLIILKMAF